MHVLWYPRAVPHPAVWSEIWCSKSRWWVGRMWKLTMSISQQYTLISFLLSLMWSEQARKGRENEEGIQETWGPLVHRMRKCFTSTTLLKKKILVLEVDSICSCWVYFFNPSPQLLKTVIYLLASKYLVRMNKFDTILLRRNVLPLLLSNKEFTETFVLGIVLHAKMILMKL